MALKKSKSLPSGVSGEYWRINKITADRVNSKVTYELSLYVSKALRQSGAKPLDYKKVFSFDVTMQEINGDLNALGYEKIKEKANSLIPDPFSRLVLRPSIPGDADLHDAEDQ